MELNNSLTPDEAQRLAGKLAFLSTTFFGGLGRAALQPFYARAHGLGEKNNNKLTFALQAAIHLIRQIIRTGKPRILPSPSASPAPGAVIYSDAYFTLGEKMLMAGQAPDLWHPGKRKPQDNGWGFVVRTGKSTYFAHGRIPD